LVKNAGREVRGELSNKKCHANRCLLNRVEAGSPPKADKSRT